MLTTKFRYIVIHLVAIVGLLLVAGCAGVSHRAGGYAPDYYTTTATANYRPVNIPGTQRRVAQQDAEATARRQIYNHVGSMPIGNETVNDVIARDTRLRARILDAVRTSEVIDWSVNPCGAVQVWVRIDMNKVRAILAECRP